MSVKNILKGAGKTLKSGLDTASDIGKNIKGGISSTADSIKAKKAANPKIVAGPGDIFERRRGKALSDPMGMYQQFVPWQLNSKYSLTIAGGVVATTAGASMLSTHHKAKVGDVRAGEGLSSMTEGGIDGASANVITPGLKKMNDASSPTTRQESARIRDNMMHNSGTWGAEGDIVFALHNMR